MEPIILMIADDDDEQYQKLVEHFRVLIGTGKLIVGSCQNLEPVNLTQALGRVRSIRKPQDDEPVDWIKEGF